MVRQHTLSTRYRVVVMVNSGLTQVQSTKQLKIGPKPQMLDDPDRLGETLENRKDHGRRRRGRGRDLPVQYSEEDVPPEIAVFTNIC